MEGRRRRALSAEGYRSPTPLRDNQERALLLYAQGLELLRDAALVLGGNAEAIGQLERCRGGAGGTEAGKEEAPPLQRSA